MDQEDAPSPPPSPPPFEEEGYVEPPWWQVDNNQTPPPNNSAADRDDAYDAAAKQRKQVMQEKYDMVRVALATHEPLYIFKREIPVSEVWGVLQHFMSGNPQPSNFYDLCQELSAIEREMGECIYWLNEMVQNGLPKLLIEPLLKRCRAVKMSVEHRRKVVESISNSIVYTYKDFKMDYLVDSRFEFNLTPLVGVAPPRHLNDAFVRKTIIMFACFVHAIGRTLNGNKHRWTIKADEVNRLETFLREKLAVNSESFCLLEEEILPGEDARRLTNHEIWWKKNGAESEKMPWTKLLKSCDTGYDGNLELISKDRKIIKLLLNKLRGKNLYPLRRAQVVDSGGIVVGMGEGAEDETGEGEMGGPGAEETGEGAKDGME